jgi:hypothetical protein
MDIYQKLFDDAKEELDTWHRDHPYEYHRTSGSSGYALNVFPPEHLVNAVSMWRSWAEIEKNGQIVMLRKDSA